MKGGVRMFIYVLLFLGIIFVAIYNQKIFPTAVAEKNGALIYLVGIIEGLILIFTNSGFLVPVVYSSLLLQHERNYSKAQSLEKVDSVWLVKQLYVRIVIINLLYFSALAFAYIPTGN